MPDTNPNRFVLWSAHTHPADFVPKEGQIVFLSWESGTPNILFGSLLLPLRQAPPTKGFHQVATLTEGRFMKLVGEGEPPTEENFEAQTFSLATRMKSISAEQLIREGFLSVFDLKNKTQERRARKSLQRALISLSGFSTSLINAVEKHRKKPVAPEGDLTQAELQARQDVLDRIKAEADARLAAEADRQAREAIIAEGHAREQRMRLAREARLARERQEREALDRARAELAARQAGKPRRVTQADLDEREARRRNARSRWEQRRPRRRPDDANND